MWLPYERCSLADFSHPNEYTKEFLTEISLAFWIVSGFVALTVFAPQAVLPRTTSSSPTLDSFQSAPIRVVKISSHSEPSELALPFVTNK